MVATIDIIDEVRRITDERGLLKHPFYQAWQRGDLTLDHLRGYAGQYWRHVLAFPRYVSVAVLATARECADAPWSFLDGVQREYVAVRPGR